MKMNKTILSLIAIVALGMAMTSCKDKKEAETKMVVTDSIKMDFKTNHYTLYSLEKGEEVPLSDSATTKWDFGINFVNIILNSHVSGPGQAGVIVKEGAYESLNSAPTEGYAYDTTSMKLAINSNPYSPGAWFVYDPVSHAFSPKAGVFFIIKTADGRYAKLEILEVKYADYDPGAMYPKKLIYKFRYTYQANGSVNFN